MARWGLRAGTGRFRSLGPFLSGLLAIQFGLGGCQPSRPSLAGLQPDFASMLTLAGCEHSGQARGQKPAESRSLLDAEPDTTSREARGARIRAVVNGDAILDEEVYAASYQALASARTEAEKAEILNAKLTEIIERELLIQDAKAKLGKGGRVRFLNELERIANKEFEKQWLVRLMLANKRTDLDEFTKFLRDQGMPVDMIRRQWVRNFIAMEFLRSRIEPNMNKIGHPETVEYYEKHPEEFKVDDAVEWQDLFIAFARHPNPQAARQFAESLVKRIRAGEDFTRLGKEYDNGDSLFRERSQGIGTRRGEIMPREAEETLFRLKEGEVALVEIDTGYHVVKVLKRTNAGREPFDDKVQKKIQGILRNQVYQQEMRRTINDLKRRAIIEVSRQNP